MRPSTGSTTSDASKQHKVTFGDWLLLGISVVSSLVALLLMRENFAKSMVMLAMFGSGVVVFAHIIRRKLRLQKYKPKQVTVVGGVPIRPSKARAVKLGIGFLAVGLVFVLYGDQHDKLFMGIAWLVTAVGASILAGLITGFLPREYFQFEVTGFVLGRRRSRVLIPWDMFLRAAPGEIHGNQAVFIWLGQGTPVAEPPSYLTKFEKDMKSANDWLGADLVIMSSNYEIDAPVLAATLMRYMQEPDARRELHSRIKVER